MTGPDRTGRDPQGPGDGELNREVVRRVMRRLNLLESLILGAAAILALLGGALVAWLLSATLGLGFRISWIVASLLLFVVPGAVVYAREKLSTTSRKGLDVEPRTGERDG